MPNFEWDDNKNETNKRKHRVSFEESAEIFEDKDAIEFLGNKESKVRFLRIGKTFEKIVLAVVYTLRTTIIRIISARQANREEINTYIEYKLTKSKKDEDAN